MRPLLATVILLCLPFAGFGQAPQFGPVLDYGIGVRAEYHSNITQNPVTEDSDYLLAPFVDFGLNRQGAALDLNFNGYAEYAKYGDNTFSSEARGALAASGLWRISEQRLHWVFENNLARSPIDILNPDTPNNIQQTNRFSTGPDLLLRLSGADQLNFGARYTNFYADARDDDYDALGLSATWSRQVSANRGYSVEFETQATSFDSNSLLNADYDRHQLALQVTHERSVSGGRDQFQVDLGFTRVEFDSPGRGSFDGPRASFNWTRIASDNSQFELDLTHEIGDIAQDIGAIALAVTPGAILQTSVTGDPFERDRVTVGWRKSWARTALDLSAGYDQQDYDVALLDQENLLLQGGFTYRFSSLVSLLLTAGYNEQDFTNVRQFDEFFTAAARLQYQRTRNFFYELTLGHVDRDSTNPLQISDDTSLTFQVTYRR